MSGMALGELIEVLESMDPEAVMPVGLGEPHSWRGIYDELAFEPAPDVKVADALARAKSALGAHYEGYKGGDNVMGEWTDIHLSFYGASRDYLPFLAIAGPDATKARMLKDDEWAYNRAFTERSDDPTR